VSLETHETVHQPDMEEGKAEVLPAEILVIV
jgi:hypothetical protein